VYEKVAFVSVGAGSVRPERRWRMVTVNVVVLAGRLSANPEFAEMPSGDTVAKLRLQVPEAGKRVLPLPVAAWDRVARKGCEHLTKGDPVMVRGRLVRRFARGQGGGRAMMEVIANEVKKLDHDGTE
jgi:single-strand DNA-binding protein